jgi:PAS domain S-box-containing protein
MTLSIAGYQVNELLSESANSLVYRGHREADNEPVIIKVLRHTYPSPAQVAWFKREYELIRSLNLPGVIKVYSLESDHHRWLMTLEDFGAESLHRLGLAGNLSLLEFLALAIEICDVLGQIHQHYIMHKDINPANLVAVRPPIHAPNPKPLWRVKLIDFGIATVLSRETPTWRNPNVLEGTLNYISPEQTGRMNRAIDYRTDFYSLGVTFYQLLTGQLPFQSNDPLELVHSHIARHPLPPHQIKTEIPPVLSDIILKLLAKNAEDRYQSSYGIKADLEACLQQWQSAGAINPFPIGQRDFSLGRFQLPQKLYGREAEIKTLLDTFDRVTVTTEPTGNSITRQQNKTLELMLVTGYAGIGKSALVQEVYKPITRRRGYFISGKFDQFQRNIPYVSLIQAFQSLIRQLLTENEAQVSAWRDKLLVALGANGQVIAEVIPEIELIIGPQPPILNLPPAEAQNRFNFTFQNFVRVFAQPDHPLVIFLDDLQWADVASLKLIQSLLAAPDLFNIFFIGAYRDNEVDAAHPLKFTLDKIQKAGTIVNQISLSPLELNDVNQLIVETLNCDPEISRPLAELILAKTDGNPFFINEFLKSLYIEDLLTFSAADNGRPGWHWDLHQIQAQDITANVVELMAAKLQRLNNDTQQALKLAACIGNQFDLQTLAIVNQKSAAQTAVDLRDAVVEGLILPLGEAHKLVEVATPDLTDELVIEYKFSHDRIQQAGYSLIPAEYKQSAHWQVGQLLLQNTPAGQLEENIFKIVNQLNLGIDLIQRPSEAEELAKLNLIAGKKAKASAAYEPALEYLETGLSLLTLLSPTEASWNTQYELTLALYEETAEAAYLNTHFEEAERLVTLVLQQARNLLDKVKAYEVEIQAYIAQNRLSDAIKAGLEVLKLLGIDFPDKPDDADIEQGLATTTSLLADKSIEALLDMPPMTDPYQLPAMRILLGISALAFFTAPKLSPLVSFKMIELSVKHGNAPESAFAYGSYGIMLGGLAGDIEQSYQFGRLALKLVDRLNVVEFKARVLTIVNGLIWHWKEPIKETLASLLDAYQIALETGDLQYAALAIRIYCSRAYLAGHELSELEQQMENYSRVIGQLGQKMALQGNEVMQQAILNLINESKEPWHLNGKYYNEDKMLPLHLASNDRGATFAFYFHKLILCYLFKNYRQALDCATEAEKYINTAVGTPFVPVFYFYDSLTRLALCPPNRQTEWESTLQQIDTNQQKMKNWAGHAPMNYLNKYYLVEAERARLLGHHSEAREFYYQAVLLAEENSYTHEEALARELAAQYYLAQNQPGLGHHHLREAYYAYQRWGAKARLQHLEAQYPGIFSQTDSETIHVTITTPVTSTSSRRITHTLDLNSILKATQALSGEIVLSNLLATLMKIAIENAGAQVGYLLLEKQEQWVVEAESVIGHDDVAVLQSIPVAEQPLPLSIINFVARTKEHVMLNDATHQGTFTNDPTIIAKRPQSVLCTPLLNQGKLTGMLYLENNSTTGAFTSEHLAVLNLISAQAAISIENATLYANLAENERKYRTLFEDSRDAIFIISPAGQILAMNPAGLSLFGYSWAEMVSMSVVETYVNPQDLFRFVQEVNRWKSVTDFEAKFRKKDGAEMDCLVTATLRQAADGAVLAYEGIIRDITGYKQAERERLTLSLLQRELTLARDIQHSLLPPVKPDWPGLHLLCYSQPAREVGGDFYAYHAFDDTRYAIAVGDVSGKGTPAALLMAISLATFQAIVGRRLAPTELLTQIDETLEPYTSASNQNCALIYAEFTPVSGGQQGGVLRMANAGCMTPIIRRANGNVEWIDVGGLPLGAGLGIELGYTETSLIVGKGDIVVLVSDGVIEAIDSAETLFGFDRFEQAIAGVPEVTAQAMLDHLKTAIALHVGQTEPNDDITIVVFQI